MRCKLHDMVMVIGGLASGYSGVIIAASEFEGCDWLVQFNHPAPGFDLFGQRTEGTEVHCPDRDLLPINPPANPIETETEREVAA